MAPYAELAVAAEAEVELWAQSAAAKMTMGTTGKTIRKTADLFIIINQLVRFYPIPFREARHGPCNVRKRGNWQVGRSGEATEPGPSSLRNKDGKSFGLFLANVRCKLLNRLRDEARTHPVLQVPPPLVTVTLVILCNLPGKFNL